MKLNLPNVTLFACTTRDHISTQLALEHCMSQIDFGNVVYVSDIPPYYIGNVEYVECSHFDSYYEICIWMMTTMPKFRHLFKDHLLSIHHDGYVVNPEAWNPEFLNYDYVGSPWPNKIVGNNGFALYSKKLLVGIESLELPPIKEACHGSDKKICITYRDKLLDFGIKYCPYELAFQFSTETYGYPSNPLGFKYNGSFGFHGPYSIATMNGFKVNLPEHDKHWLEYKGDESELLSAPQFLGVSAPHPKSPEAETSDNERDKCKTAVNSKPKTERKRKASTKKLQSANP